MPYTHTSDFEVAVHMLEENTESVNIIADNPDKTWKAFQDYFKNIYAAGGVVLNDKNEMLWIYRLEKWDLPKGKMEKGEAIEETAVREVEEECGISGLWIRKRLPDTFHMYYHKQHILKITHWFEMEYNGQQQLIPQTEEGITQVKWMAKKDLKIPTQNTYSNIFELIQPYVK